MYHFLFNDIRCLDMGVLAVRRPSIPSPQEDWLEHKIPGRDGVIMDKIKRLAPIDVEIQLNFMTDPDKFAEQFRRVKRWLSGPGKLQFSDDLNWFYKVYRVNCSEIERGSRRIGTFSAVFRCDPYVYSEIGDKYMSASDCLNNTFNECHPIYHVTASGSWTLTVNGNTFTGSGQTFIDTDTMTATDGNGNIINTSVVGNYADFYLLEGSNTISISGGTLEVKPRWRSR